VEKKKVCVGFRNRMKRLTSSPNDMLKVFSVRVCPHTGPFRPWARKRG